jgi:basic membrane protein A
MNKQGISRIVVAVIVIIVLIIAAVAAYYFTRPSTEPSAKIGLIIATGGLGDKSFNDISYAGCVRAQDELGITFDYVEPEAIAEYQGYQTDFAKTGQYELIICVGFDQADALNITAQAYPNQSFALVDMVVAKPNVASLLFKSNEASYLVGVAAGMMTETDIIGFVGGMDIPLIRDFFGGYEAGAQWANPNVTILDPVFVGDWADPTTGKELAESLLDLDADGIYVAAGKSGLGAVESIHENEIWGYGVDACQCYLYPEEILVSATKRVDLAVFEMIEAVLEGTFAGGIFNRGLKEDWVGVCRLTSEEAFWEQQFNFTHSPIGADVLAKINEARTKIISGEIVVPTAF